MEEMKVRQQKGSAKRPDDSASEGEKKGPFAYYLATVLLFLLKVAVIFVMIFSLQNISDMIRAVPFVNSLPPFPALVVSYFFVHVFCMYFFIVWFGSFREYFKRLGPTLIEIKGFLVYLIAVPLCFVMLAGGAWWCVARVKIAAFVAFPLQWLPNFFFSLYAGGMSFYLFSAMTVALPIALLFVVVLLQGPVREMKPAVSRSASRKNAADDNGGETGAKPVIDTVAVSEEDEDGKPIQPKGQPPLRMK